MSSNPKHSTSTPLVPSSPSKKLASLSNIRNILTTSKISKNTKESISEIISPGDIILLKAPNLFQESTGQEIEDIGYDQTIVVLDYDLNCLKISLPKAMVLKIWQFMHSNRQPKIIRPKISEEKRKQFIQECLSLVGKKYDFKKLISQNKEQGNPIDLGSLGSHDIFQAFCKINPEFLLKIEEMEYLDLFETGKFSPNDFDRMASLMPEEFEVIEDLIPSEEEIGQIPEGETEQKGSIFTYGTTGVSNLIKTISSIANQIISFGRYDEVINFCTSAIEYLVKFAFDNPSMKIPAFKLISAFTGLLYASNEIRVKGLSTTRLRKLLMSLLNITLFNPLNPKMIVLKQAAGWTINNKMMGAVTGGMQEKATEGIKYLGSRIGLLKAKI